MPTTFSALLPAMSTNNEFLPSYDEVPTTSQGPHNSFSALPASSSSSHSPVIPASDDFANGSSWSSHLTAFIDPTGSEGSFKALFIGAGGSGTSKNIFRTQKWWVAHLSMRFNSVVVYAMSAEIKEVRLIVRLGDFAFSGVPTELAATPALRGFWNDFVSCFTVWGTSFLNDFVEHQGRAADQPTDLRIRFGKNSFAKYVFLGVSTSGDTIGQTVPLYQVSNVQPLAICVKADHSNMHTPLNSTTNDGRRLAGHLGVMNGSVIITLEMPCLKAGQQSHSR